MFRLAGYIATASAGTAVLAVLSAGLVSAIAIVCAAAPVSWRLAKRLLQGR